MNRNTDVRKLCSPLMYHCTKVVPYWERREQSRPINMRNKSEIMEKDNESDEAAQWKRTSHAWGWEQMDTVLPILRVGPTAGGFPQHGNQACECLSECFNQSRSEKRGSRRVSGCWSWILFCRVAPSKGPAGSVEDVLPWTWTPELISSNFKSILWSFEPISLPLEMHRG